jgi:hypothetical protein
MKPNGQSVASASGGMAVTTLSAGVIVMIVMTVIIMTTMMALTPIRVAMTKKTTKNLRMPNPRWLSSHQNPSVNLRRRNHNLGHMSTVYGLSLPRATCLIGLEELQNTAQQIKSSNYGNVHLIRLIVVYDTHVLGLFLLLFFGFWAYWRTYFFDGSNDTLVISCTGASLIKSKSGRESINVIRSNTSDNQRPPSFFIFLDSDLTVVDLTASYSYPISVVSVVSLNPFDSRASTIYIAMYTQTHTHTHTHTHSLSLFS